MSKKYIDYRLIPINLDDCKYLGKGHSGEVYLMPNGKVIKIFRNSTSCKAEFDILKSVEGSPHFPRVYEISGNYMIREYVGGTNVYDYLLKNGIQRSFVINVANLVDDMKLFGFTKLEIRFPHLFVQDNGTLMIIDPRKSYEYDIPYPKSFLRKLKKMRLLDKFMEILNQERPDLEWEYS